MRVSLRPELTTYTQPNRAGRVGLQKSHIAAPMDTVSFGAQQKLCIEGDYVSTPNVTIKEKALDIGGNAKLYNVVLKETLKTHGSLVAEDIEANNIDIGGYAALHNVKGAEILKTRGSLVADYIEAKNIDVYRFANLHDVKGAETLKTRGSLVAGDIEAKNIDVGIHANLHNVKGAETLKTVWNLTSTGTIEAKKIYASGYAALHDVKGAETLKTGWHLTSDGTIEAKNIYAGGSARLHDVKGAEILKTVESLESTGTIETKVINSGGDVHLNTVYADSIIARGERVTINNAKRLDEIAFVTGINPNISRYLKISEFSEDGKKIDVLLGNFQKLVIDGVEDMDEALKRFNFFEAVKKEAIESGELIVTRVKQFSPEEIAKRVVIKCVKEVKNAL